MTEDLTYGELKILNALRKLEKLWEKSGGDLYLVNGHSLNKGDLEIYSLPGIKSTKPKNEK